MIRHLITLIAVITCILLASPHTQGKQQAQEKASEQTLRVLAWNIWHGGHSKKYPEKGFKATLDILKDSEADIILMIETYGASDSVAKHLGYHHRLLSSNLSIYSRYPITAVYTFPSISTFNFGGVEIDMNGQKVRLFDVWLHYLPDTRDVPTDKSEKEILAWDDAGSRDEELQRILAAIAPMIKEADSIPIIMGGDFNSHSHLDWTKATKNKYNHGGAVVRWTVSVLMEKAGFIDSYRKVNPDPVTHIGTTWMNPNAEDKPERQDRIDYIYYKGKGIRAVKSESFMARLGETLQFKGKEYFYASDHGFVLSTFKIKRG